ncbi:MAG: lipid A deacylase LpxR family protein [Rhodospirillaceae bacterium]|nr:lipid A deacylase LpxR family protein [Rhodospirillaceae bacterium]
MIRPGQLWPFFLVVFCLVVLLSQQGSAQNNSDEGILTFQFENDIFGNTDQHFTHGTRLAWMSPEDKVPGWVKDAAGYMPTFDPKGSKRIVYSLGQSIFTPDDLKTSTLIPEDRPYAGWLYGGIGLVSVTGDRLDNVELDVGVIGSASFAEDVQKTWHGWFGFQRPNGWDNQLKNELGILLSYERKWRRWARFKALGLDSDITPHVGVNLGNVLTQGAVGFIARIGGDLSRHYDYGPPRIRPSLPGSDYFVSDGGFSWYVFFGAEGRGVLHSIFLDGNTFRDSHSVDKKPLVGDVQGGIAFIVGPVRLAYTHVFRTKEFGSQDDTDQWGAFSISARF